MVIIKVTFPAVVLTGSCLNHKIIFAFIDDINTSCWSFISFLLNPKKDICEKSIFAHGLCVKLNLGILTAGVIMKVNLSVKSGNGTRI